MTSTQKILDCLQSIEIKIAQQLNCILHAPRFLKLEASWRALDRMLLLVKELRCESIQIRLMHVTPENLRKDFRMSNDETHSMLFQKMYHEELKQAGGFPFGMILLDDYIQPEAETGKYDSLFVIETIGKIAESIFAPIIAGAHPKLLDAEELSALPLPWKPERIYQQKKYTRWNQLRNNTYAQFIGVIASRILSRSPYHEYAIDHSWLFTETIEKHAEYCWENSVYLYAESVLRSFANTGWFMQTSDPLRIEYPCEMHWTPQLLDRLQRCGFLEYFAHPHQNEVAFYNPQSISSHPQSLTLNEILCASRFMHYLHVLCRLQIGKTTDTKTLEDFLQQWFLNYCAMPNENTKASLHQYPLQTAKIKITQDRFNASRYFCQVQLQLQKPLQHMKTQMQWTTSFEK